MEDYAVGTFSQLELIIYLVIIIDIGPFFDLLPIKLYCHYFILFLISSIGIIWKDRLRYAVHWQKFDKNFFTNFETSKVCYVGLLLFDEMHSYLRDSHSCNTVG